MARPSALSNLINRWGTYLSLALGALVLLGGLGATGLWEPWEMDRADLARTLANPPEAVLAVGAGQPALDEALTKAAADAGVAAKRPDENAATSLRSALDYARTRTVAALVLDVSLLLPDPSNAAGWTQAGKLSAEAMRATAGGTLVLVRQSTSPPVDELRRRLAVERWRDVWDDASTTWSLDAGFDPASVQPALEALAAEQPGDDTLRIVEGADVAALTAALADGASATSGRVAFKDKGQIQFLPPLESWLRAAAYRAFGASEWTTRLPGAVLAFMALWVLLFTVRTVWSGRVALLTGIVLVSIPLFFGQARIIAGEPAFILALTLVGSGLLLTTLNQVPRALVWAYLVTGLVVGALGKGVFALSLFGLVALTIPLVRGLKRPAEWAPALMFIGAAIVLQLVASGASTGSFWGGLDFRADLFSDGPSTYSRTFDVVIRALGFGMAPWSPLIAIAAGALVFSSLAEKDPRGLIVAAWFFLPIVAVMASLKVGNQFLFVGVGAAAIATALLIERVLDGEAVPKYFVALALLCMFYILRRELKQSPEPLVGFLAFDPPFAKEGNLRFPETVALHGLYKGWFILATLFLVFHFGQLLSFALKAMRWARQSRPFLILVGVMLLLLALFALASIGRLHGVGMGSSYADSIQAAQRALIARIASPSDPLILLALLTGLFVLIAVVFKWVFSDLGAFVARVVPDGLAPARRGLLAAFAGLWVLAAGLAAAQVALPEGYLGELLASGTGVVGLLGAVAAGGLAWLLLRNRLDALLVALGVLALAVQTQLLRDADLRSNYSIAPLALGFLALALALAKPLLARVEHFVFGVLAGLSLIGLAYTVVLVDRGTLVAEVVHASELAQGDSAFGKSVGYLANVFVVLPMLGLIVLLFNRALPNLVVAVTRTAEGATRLSERLTWLAELLVRWLQHRYVAVGFVLTLAFIGTLTHLVSLEPAIAVNVSQKHILDTWAGDRTHGTDSMFKHGSFATQGRKDTNFYTADIPEIRDRQSALRVLLGAKDEVLEVETAHGTETLVLPGFSAANDKNGDKKRDGQVLRGFATSLGEGSLTDASAAWPPKSLIGKRLGDASGRSWAIIDNDATTVRVAQGERLGFALSPKTRAYYVIADAGLELTATAEVPERRALLLPADQLSDLNYAWRQISGGRHLPVLDGSSYRVLLTTSWLEQDEPQQNRLALATFSDESFKKLDDPRLKRVWGTFDDTLQLVGYSTDKDVVGTGDKIRLTLYFKTLKLVKKSLKLFIHMDKTGGGSRIAGDHWPLNPTRHSEENKNCGGCYRTDHWLVGDIVQDSYEIEIPEGNTGEYMIWFGLYQPGPDTRAVVRDWDKKNARHDGGNRLGIGTIRVK